MKIEIAFVVRPEMNPDLGLEEQVVVLPGVASQVEIRAALKKMILDYEAMATRSIEAWLKKQRG